MKKIIKIAIASCLAGAIVFLCLGTATSERTIAAFATAALPPALYAAHGDYARRRKADEIDAELPAALMHVASLPRRTPLKEALADVSKSGYGALGAEFAKTVRQLESGIPPRQALEDLSRRNGSELLEKTGRMLASANKSGADLSTAFRQIADEAYSLSSLAREHAAATAMQKYTLLAGGGLVVPVMLGLLLSTVTSLHATAGFPAQDNAIQANGQGELSAAVVTGARAYLGIFSAVAGFFVAFSEGNRKKAVAYFAVLFPVSQLAFAIASGIPTV